eukprot:scaffold12001_cov116-Isochrysis_galbana.AAC.14
MRSSGSGGVAGISNANRVSGQSRCRRQMRVATVHQHQPRGQADAIAQACLSRKTSCRIGRPAACGIVGSCLRIRLRRQSGGSACARELVWQRVRSSRWRCVCLGQWEGVRLGTRSRWLELRGCVLWHRVGCTRSTGQPEPLTRPLDLPHTRSTHHLQELSEKRIRRPQPATRRVRLKGERQQRGQGATSPRPTGCQQRLVSGTAAHCHGWLSARSERARVGDPRQNTAEQAEPRGEPSVLEQERGQREPPREPHQQAVAGAHAACRRRRLGLAQPPPPTEQDPKLLRTNACQAHWYPVPSVADRQVARAWCVAPASQTAGAGCFGPRRECGGCAGVEHAERRRCDRHGATHAIDADGQHAGADGCERGGGEGAQPLARPVQASVQQGQCQLLHQAEGLSRANARKLMPGARRADGCERRRRAKPRADHCRQIWRGPDAGSQQLAGDPGVNQGRRHPYVRRMQGA